MRFLIPLKFMLNVLFLPEEIEIKIFITQFYYK